MLNGIYLQLYMDKFPTIGRDDWIKSHLDQAKELGIAGIAWHSFVGVMTEDKFEPLAKLCHERGLQSLAAFGLGKDSNVHPDHAGVWIGDVAARQDCDGAILDAEGRWEDDKPEIEAERSRDLRIALRASAPHALIADQPWFKPTVHWSIFPWAEFSRCVDVRAPQVYWVDFRKTYGDKAYRNVYQSYEDSWFVLEQKLLKPQNLIRPRIPTIQGYGQRYEDVLDCLNRNFATIIWNEPWPEQSVLDAIKTHSRLRCVSFSS